MVNQLSNSQANIDFKKLTKAREAVVKSGLVAVLLSIFYVAAVNMELHRLPPGMRSQVSIIDVLFFGDIMTIITITYIVLLLSNIALWFWQSWSRFVIALAYAVQLFLGAQDLMERFQLGGWKSPANIPIIIGVLLRVYVFIVLFSPAANRLFKVKGNVQEALKI